ncbi:26.2 kDa heat shock protein mitochondrial [Phtheirospermum japonicum]|uniref:26.2 kDa heat shock protein mitochondrial n=1 Tax=Phtheirospermum japonicum TaxID=374723 RepID=A0A830CLJ6_9LAMI|nr:26.2 kDa heat shock protein mitochondrial [Phtheirospermum japonicum]
MPRVGKENIKVRIEKDTVIMKGESQKDFEDDELGPRYDFSIQLPMVEQYNTDKIKKSDMHYEFTSITTHDLFLAFCFYFCFFIWL